jgi:tetratricopeptide (TPR) repeat protein
MIIGTIIAMNDRKKAVECYEKALKVALDTGNMKSAVAAYSFLGNRFMGVQELEKRFDYAQKGYELAKKVGAISAQAFVGFALSDMYTGRGDINTALFLSDESVALNRKSGNLQFLALSLVSLAQIYTVFGEWDKSEKCLNEALNIARKVNDVVGIGFASSHMGFLLLERGEYAKAREFGEKAYYLSVKAGAKSWQAGFLSLLIRSSIGLGELEKAEEQIISLQQMTQELRHQDIFGGADLLRAKLFSAQKKWSESITYFENVLQDAENQGLRNWRVRIFAKQILLEYAQVCLERNQEGDRQKALSLLNQALEMFQKVNAKRDVEKTEAIILNIEKGIPITLETNPMSLVASGYEVLDKLLYGGIRPTFSVALTSPSCNERDALIKSFLETGAKNGETTFYLATNSDLAGLLAEQFPSVFYLFICNPQADAIVRTSPNVFTLKGVESLTNLNIVLTQAIRKIDPTLKTPKRICIGLLSDVLLQQGPLQTRKWLTELLTQLRLVGFTALAVIDPLIHSSEQLHAVLGLFDGEVNIREAETDQGSVRFLKVKRMSSQKYLKEEIRLTEE